jgi:hypothetical protein
MTKTAPPPLAPKPALRCKVADRLASSPTGGEPRRWRKARVPVVPAAGALVRLPAAAALMIADAERACGIRPLTPGARIAERASR